MAPTATMHGTFAGGKSAGTAKSRPKLPTFVIMRLPKAFRGMPRRGLHKFKVEVIHFKTPTARERKELSGTPVGDRNLNKGIPAEPASNF